METLTVGKLKHWLLPFFFVGMLLLLVTAAVAHDENISEAAALPNWLEPRGLSLVELVGQVPDTYLQGAIISYDGGEGIVVYESGNRLGNTVIVTTTMYTRFSRPSWAGEDGLTTFGCLGQTPRYDHMGTVVPESFLRVYDSSGNDRTSEIVNMYITKMEHQKPIASSSAYNRYVEDAYGPNKITPLPVLEAEGLPIPANSGCRFELFPADYYPMTGVFTLDLNPSIEVSVIASQEATFKSYIGEGNVGIFTPLMEQLQGLYPNRHGRITLESPAQADYFLAIIPAMPGDAYTNWPDYNNDRPTSGTYRLGEVVELSTDLTSSAAFPLWAVWQDADQSPTEFLPLLETVTSLAPPEYVIPAGIAFNPCFTQGNCSPSILQEIYDKEMTLEIVYLSVEIPADGVEETLIKLAGPNWSLSLQNFEANTMQTGAASVDLKSANSLSPDSIQELDKFVYLPLISKTRSCSQYPCGWFDGIGRMLGYMIKP